METELAKRLDVAVEQIGKMRESVAALKAMHDAQGAELRELRARLTAIEKVQQRLLIGLAIVATSGGAAAGAIAN